MTPERDGYGQSWWDDVRSMLRFRRYRRRPTIWSSDDDRAAEVIAAHPAIERFGDAITGVAQSDGRTWVVVERMWHGWPDPPQYAFFELEYGRIRSARDFDQWPAAWTFEDRSPLDG